jgi:Fur family ferric uptake transcriptional regulator
MKYIDYKKLLKSHNLRITDCRIDVLERFYNSGHALSYKDLEDDLKDYDRVTLYRTLNSFINQGLLHQIPGDSGFATYGLCREDCNEEAHHHNHVHFKCNVCGHVECLPNLHNPQIDLPDYEIKESYLIVNGVCKICKEEIQLTRHTEN